MKHLAAAASAAFALTAGFGALAQTEILTGLNNPRGLDFAPNGDLYISEAGTGGGPAAPCVNGPEGLTCPGETGSIAVLRRSGRFERIAVGLYSTAAPNGSAAAGPADVAAVGANHVVATVGLGTDPAYRETLKAEGIKGAPGTLVRKAGRAAKNVVADIAAHEAAYNPDMGELASNPYGLAFDRARGVFLVADAGANTLIEVRGYQTRTVATFPATPNPAPFGPPFYDSVPTDVAVGPDGAYYVTQLTGFPFIQGAANIFRVLPNGAMSVWASGYTNLVSLATSHRGVYAVEIASQGLLNGPIGSVIFTPWSDPTQKEVVASGLFAPGGVAVGPDDDVYVVVNSILPGAGKVLKFER